MFKKLSGKSVLTRVLVSLLLSLLPIVGVVSFPHIVFALTTADVTVNATPAYVSISCNVSFYNFGTVAASSTTNTTTSYFGITNASTVQTDQTIGVTAATWSGGDGWSHDDGGTAGDNITAIYANRGGTWGTGDIIVKYASPNYVYENCPITTNYDFGLSLQAPTVLYDAAEKTITVRVSATQG